MALTIDGPFIAASDLYRISDVRAWQLKFEEAAKCGVPGSILFSRLLGLYVNQVKWTTQKDIRRWLLTQQQRNDWQRSVRFLADVGCKLLTAMWQWLQEKVFVSVRAWEAEGGSPTAMKVWRQEKNDNQSARMYDAVIAASASSASASSVFASSPASAGSSGSGASAATDTATATATAGTGTAAATAVTGIAPVAASTVTGTVPAAAFPVTATAVSSSLVSSKLSQMRMKAQAENEFVGFDVDREMASIDICAVVINGFFTAVDYVIWLTRNWPLDSQPTPADAASLVTSTANDPRQNKIKRQWRRARRRRQRKIEVECRRQQMQRARTMQQYAELLRSRRDQNASSVVGAITADSLPPMLPVAAALAEYPQLKNSPAIEVLDAILRFHAAKLSTMSGRELGIIVRNRYYLPNQREIEEEWNKRRATIIKNFMENGMATSQINIDEYLFDQSADAQGDPLMDDETYNALFPSPAAITRHMLKHMDQVMQTQKKEIVEAKQTIQMLRHQTQRQQQQLQLLQQQQQQQYTQSLHQLQSMQPQFFAGQQQSLQSQHTQQSQQHLQQRQQQPHDMQLQQQHHVLSYNNLQQQQQQRQQQQQQQNRQQFQSQQSQQQQQQYSNPMPLNIQGQTAASTHNQQYMPQIEETTVILNPPPSKRQRTEKHSTTSSSNIPFGRGSSGGHALRLQQRKEKLARRHQQMKIEREKKQQQQLSAEKKEREQKEREEKQRQKKEREEKQVEEQQSQSQQSGESKSLDVDTVIAQLDEIGKDAANTNEKKSKKTSESPQSTSSSHKSRINLVSTSENSPESSTSTSQEKQVHNQSGTKRWNIREFELSQCSDNDE